MNDNEEQGQAVDQMIKTMQLQAMQLQGKGKHSRNQRIGNVKGKHKNKYKPLTRR